MYTLKPLVGSSGVLTSQGIPAESVMCVNLFIFKPADALTLPKTAKDWNKLVLFCLTLKIR